MDTRIKSAALLVMGSGAFRISFAYPCHKPAKLFPAPPRHRISANLRDGGDAVKNGKE